jgi:hypothetical protein
MGLNRFNGFGWGKTAEAVLEVCCRMNTPLKQGVNESAANTGLSFIRLTAQKLRCAPGTIIHKLHLNKTTVPVIMLVWL